MSITLLQQNSFEFDGRATRNIFPVKNKIGIDCVIKCVEEKLKLKDDIKQHVLFLKGRTGSGKSTCMPVKLFEHFSKNPSLISGNLRVLVTENRVILSTSIAVDNCNIPGTYVKYGINTGYATGQGKTVIQNPSYLLYISTELFKRRLIQRLPLPQIIVIDECHEMELYLIELLYHIKQYLNDKTIPTDKKPLFIFASATLDLDRMIKYFFDNPDDIYKDALMINYIAGSRNYPVDEYYLTKEEENKLDINQFVKDILTKKLEISIKSDQVVKNNIPARDMLIFTYGGAGLKIFECSSSIKKYCKYPCYVSTVLYDDTNRVLKWRQEHQNQTRVLILPYNARCLGFASKLLVNNHDLDKEAQQHEIKIYISTNAIETGKTIITLYQVFDVGLRFYKLIRPLTHHIPFMLTKVPVNKSSTIQRCGRVGRTCKGKAYRMFSKDTYELLEDNDTPGNIFTVSLGYQVIGAKTERLQLLETNDYVQTNPLDLMIATGQDLCQAGYYTPFGELINDIRDVDSINNWVSEAEYHYYTNPKMWNTNEGIYNLLFICRLNRSNLGENTSYSGQTSENRMFTYDSESILSAYDARQMYVKYKLGLSNIFRQKVLE